MKTLADQLRSTLTLLENIDQSASAQQPKSAGDLSQLKKSILNLEKAVDSVTERNELTELNWKKGLAGAAAAGAMALGGLGSAQAASPDLTQGAALQCSAVFMVAAERFAAAGDPQMAKSTQNYANDMYSIARTEARMMDKVNQKSAKIMKNTIENQYDQYYARFSNLDSDQLSTMAVKCYQQLKGSN